MQSVVVCSVATSAVSIQTITIRTVHGEQSAHEDSVQLFIDCAVNINQTILIEIQLNLFLS